MKQSNQCPKCGSTDIVADAKALDRNEGLGRELTLMTYSNPDALIFKGYRSTTLSAWVCVDCGYVEYYADAPDYAGASVFSVLPASDTSLTAVIGP